MVKSVLLFKNCAEGPFFFLQIYKNALFQMDSLTDYQTVGNIVTTEIFQIPISAGLICLHHYYYYVNEYLCKCFDS